MITLDTNQFSAQTQGDWVVKDITEKEAVYQFLLTDHLTEWDTFSMDRDPAAKPVYSSHKGFRLYRNANESGLYVLDYVDIDKTYYISEVIASNAESLFNKSMDIILEN